jgi:hypothetical protein
MHDAAAAFCAPAARPIAALLGSHALPPHPAAAAGLCEHRRLLLCYHLLCCALRGHPCHMLQCQMFSG